jgi:hypothetical protein
MATSNEPPVIYYVNLSPTLISYGTPLQFSAITSTNVERLTLNYDGISTSLSQTGAGDWQGAFPFTMVGTPGPTGPILLTLTASKADGTSTSIQVPITITTQGLSTASQGHAR